MNPLNKHQAAGRSVFMSSAHGLANTLAVVTTFLGAPPLYSKTIGFVHGYTIQHYGYGFEDLTAFAWGCVCACLVFFISRASLSTLIVMGGLAIASRVF